MSELKSSGLLLALAAVLTAGALAVVILWPALWGEKPGEPRPAAGQAEESQGPADPIPPAMIKYRQTGEIAVGLAKARALAVGPEDRIYVGGDKLLRIFQPDGAKGSEIAMDDEPRCLAVVASGEAPGRVYVGMADHVEVVGPDGKREASWKPPAQWCAFTSIAAADEGVFVADAANRIVWHYTAAGKLQGRMGDRDPKRNVPGFLITSPYFDLAVNPTAHLLYVVNPRQLRLEAYTFQGDFELSWGKGSPAVEDFYGCCNPAHFAILPDRRFVTAEKGSPRVKIYGREGKFECVVAGPEQLPHEAADLAADGRGRILVLDAESARVRIFEPKNSQGEAKR